MGENIYTIVTMQGWDGIVRYRQEYLFLAIEHEDTRTMAVVGIVGIYQQQGDQINKANDEAA